MVYLKKVRARSLRRNFARASLKKTGCYSGFIMLHRLMSRAAIGFRRHCPTKTKKNTHPSKTYCKKMDQTTELAFSEHPGVLTTLQWSAFRLGQSCQVGQDGTLPIHDQRFNKKNKRKKASTWSCINTNMPPDDHSSSSEQSVIVCSTTRNNLRSREGRSQA